MEPPMVQNRKLSLKQETSSKIKNLSQQLLDTSVMGDINRMANLRRPNGVYIDPATQTNGLHL